jgi:hypothetical protein
MITYRHLFSSKTDYEVIEITPMGSRRVDKDDNRYLEWIGQGNTPEIHFSVPGLFVENGEIKESPEYLENSIKNAKELAKRLVSGKRYNTEQNYKLTTHLLSVPISRESRANIMAIIDYMATQPEDSVISFKDANGNFVDVTKTVLEEVFSDIMMYVQMLYGLEKTKYQAINACMSVNEVKTLIESE